MRDDRTDGSTVVDQCAKWTVLGCAPGRGTRRRGEELQRAIFDAVLAELAEVGYEGLTMEGVAARAHTGKAALYRRWSSKEDLLVDALQSTLPTLDDPPDTGSVRDDLVVLLGYMAAMINSPTGCALWSILGNHQSSPEMVQTAHTRVIGPRKQMTIDTLRRGAERGEVRPDAVCPLAAVVGPAMVLHHYLTVGAPISRDTVEAIVDGVVMPLITRS